MTVMFRCPVAYGGENLKRASVRYDLIERLTEACRGRGLTLVAFGIGDDELRLVLDGDEDGVDNVVRVTKAGTSRMVRNLGQVVMWGVTERTLVREAELAARVAWAHRVVDGDPLASPWTSHRDLLGFRRAAFFDASPVARRVDVRLVHQLAGGAELPVLRRRAQPTERGLGDVLRVSAAVLGVPPGHRRSFRLFVHLGRALGWAPAELAKALVLTARRIRQLSVGSEPLLPVAFAHLNDARLAHVP